MWEKFLWTCFYRNIKVKKKKCRVFEIKRYKYLRWMEARIMNVNVRHQISCRRIASWSEIVIATITNAAINNSTGRDWPVLATFWNAADVKAEHTADCVKDKLLTAHSPWRSSTSFYKIHVVQGCGQQVFPWDEFETFFRELNSILFF